MTPGPHPGGPSVVDRLSGLEPANWPAAQDLGLLLIGPQKPAKPLRFLVNGLSLHKPEAASVMAGGWGLEGGGVSSPRNSPKA